ncbi:hypothetical protein SESBI_11557 [Sesbania bispinosa]|nr:hypothetical protein SESBI_11557 [Sesbania bispinosa]
MTPSQTSLHVISRRHYDWSHLQKDSSVNFVRDPQLVCWIPPQHDEVSLNVDGSVINNPGVGGFWGSS